jgi:antitoxin VapB
MKEAKIFTNGQSQAVRLPKEYRFSSKTVLVNKVGNCVYLIPKENPWEALINSCGEFSEDFMETREQGTQNRNFF